jgi:Serine incorporator (Serinc)
MLRCCSRTGQSPRCLNEFILIPRSAICRNVVSTEQSVESEEIVYIGRSETAMWMRVVSSWVRMLLYTWSLLAPLIMPDR